MGKYWDHVRESIGTRGYTEEAAERGQRAFDTREAQLDAKRYDDIRARARSGKHVTQAERAWAQAHFQALKRPFTTKPFDRD